MIVYFKTKELEFFYKTPLKELRGKKQYSEEIIKQFKFEVQRLMAIPNISVLKQFKGLKFKKLNKDRAGKNEYSIRLNDQYRLILKVEQQNKVELLILEISKHYE